MNVAIKVVDQDGHPVPGVKVDVFLDEATQVAGNQHSDASGEIALSNKTPCAGHRLKFVASRDGYEKLEHIHHPHSNSATVKLQMTVVPLVVPPVVPVVVPPVVSPPRDPDLFRRSKRAWITFLAIEAVLAAGSPFLHHDLAEGIAMLNPLFICLVSSFLTAKLPLYRWTAAFWICAAHLANFFVIAGAIGNRRSGNAGTFILYALGWVTVNLLLVAGIERFRTLLQRIPLVGKLVKAECVHPLGWELRAR